MLSKITLSTSDNECCRKFIHQCICSLKPTSKRKIHRLTPFNMYLNSCHPAHHLVSPNSHPLLYHSPLSRPILHPLKPIITCNLGNSARVPIISQHTLSTCAPLEQRHRPTAKYCSGVCASRTIAF